MWRGLRGEKSVGTEAFEARTTVTMAETQLRPTNTYDGESPCQFIVTGNNYKTTYEVSEKSAERPNPDHINMTLAKVTHSSAISSLALAVKKSDVFVNQSLIDLVEYTVSPQEREIDKTKLGRNNKVIKTTYLTDVTVR